MDSSAESIFSSLTGKQHEALMLACSHLTSKQIAIKLGVAPVTIDKRIDSVRSKLGNVSRAELLHLYQGWHEGYGQTVNDPIILPETLAFAPHLEPQSSEQSYLFEDSLTFDLRSSWDSSLGSVKPGLRPSDLGVAGKLLAILAGAVAILAVVVLSLAVATSLRTILEV